MTRPTSFYYVLEGTVRLYREGRAERAQTLRFIGPGEIFGYRAALADEHYAANAVTHRSTTLLAYPIPLVRQLIDESPRLMQLIVKQMARELGIADRRIVTLTQGMLRERMAETLLFLRSTYGQPRRPPRHRPALDAPRTGGTLEYEYLERYSHAQTFRTRGRHRLRFAHPAHPRRAQTARTLAPQLSARAFRA